MQDSIYRGYIRHSRVSPKEYSFKYSTSMFFVNLNNIENIGKISKLIGYNKFNLFSFSSEKYLAQYSGTMLQRLQQIIEQHGYVFNVKRAYILTNLSYLGFCYNPVSFYYCYDANDKLVYILAEVNNTPWNERHVYVLACDEKLDKYTFDTNKCFHISPFMPMDMQYKWYVNKPGAQINIHIQLFNMSERKFDATLSLKQQTITTIAMLKVFILYPFISQKVMFGIYWQAFKLWLRRFPVYPHSTGERL